MKPAGDLILYNANVLTINARQPKGEALAVRAGRIAGVGSREDVSRLANSVRQLDLQGKTVLPGFIDSHVHFTWTGMQELAIDLLGCRSVEDVQDLVAQEAGNRPHGDLIFGMGINHYLFPGGRLPDAEDLAAAAPEHPVFLGGVTGHYSLANRRALELVGLPPDTPGLGAHGLLRDRANTLAGRKMRNLFAREQGFGRLHRAAAERAVSVGLTTVHALDGSEQEDDPTVRELLSIAPHLPLDLVVWYQTTDVDAARHLNLPRIGGCILLDGDFGPHTAALLQPYADQPEISGTLYYSQEQINSFVERANRAGLQVAMHAVGDRAVEQALEAYERALEGYPRSDHRHRIEHFSIFNQRQALRAREMGICLGIQPPFNGYFGGHTRLFRILGEERALRTDAVRSLVDLGIHVGGGSDSTVTPMDPMYGVHCAVNHSIPSERLSADRALQLYTLDNAYLAFEEQEKGSLEVGKRGDLVVLDADPLAVERERLKDIRVEMTILGGRIVFPVDHGGTGDGA